MLPPKGSPTYFGKKKKVPKFLNNIVSGKEMSFFFFFLEKKRNGFPIYFFPYPWIFAKKSKSNINV